MPDLDPPDTIAAIATPIGEGGIAIIRLSGEKAFSIAGKILRFKNEMKISDCLSHTVYLAEIQDGQGLILDQVLVTLFRSPKSYTGEDVLEISAHGGLAVTRAILDQLIHAGARHAEPGEFTKRAFLNGKMDLTQAEAVLDLIKAKSEMSLEVAMRQLSGSLSLKFRSLKDQMMKLYAHLEAAIDFPEEDLEIEERQQILDQYNKIENEIDSLVSSFSRGSLLREGLSVVIIGKPNVGKSSLFNALLERDRALVSEHPGTTRDELEESISIGGIYIRLTDTAGLSAGIGHPLDQMGIERTRQALRRADLYLYIVDGSLPLHEEDREAFLALEKNKPLIILINKSDLHPVLDPDSIRKTLRVEKGPILQVSTKTKLGFKDLENQIAEIALAGKNYQAGEQITRLRHKHALESSLDAVRRSKQSLDGHKSMELVTIDLKAALDPLRELIGEIYSEDLLDVIFAEFCIGK